MSGDLKKCVETLRRGGVVLYPTDTIWGIGCDATNDQAVRRVYGIKKSDNKNSMIVLCDSPAMASKYVSRFPDAARQLFEVSDKPLTLILPGGCGLSPELIPEDGTIAIRIPDNEYCLNMIGLLGRPVVSTSANISGEPWPPSFARITTDISDAVDFIVDPRNEGRPTGKPSSIIKVGEGGEIEIIRP